VYIRNTATKYYYESLSKLTSHRYFERSAAVSLLDHCLHVLRPGHTYDTYCTTNTRARTSLGLVRRRYELIHCDNFLVARTEVVPYS